MKIILILGKLVKIDRVIVMCDLFYYIRVFIEVDIDEEFLVNYIWEWMGGYLKLYSGIWVEISEMY